MISSLILLITSLISVAHCSLEAKLRFPEYCTLYGYPVESHVIQTQDNYNLQFFRIQSKNSKIAPGKKVVYLQHGLIDSSDTFIVNEQHLAPAFVFANKGFDVWLGNTRGNRYSNAQLSPLVRNYWNLTFDEMASFDLEAAFSYISNKTQQKIHYVGHSQGSAIMFAALSEKVQAIRTAIASFTAWGPVAYLTDFQSAHPRRSVLNLYQKLFGQFPVLLIGDGTMGFDSSVCLLDPFICTAGLSMVSEKNNSVNNLKRMPTVMGHYPAGTSIKNAIHFDQLSKAPYFRKFDYGEKGNVETYGQKVPPEYDLGNIDIPVHLMIGKYDKLATVKNSERLWNELTNSPKKTRTFYDYGHATFIWGKSTEHVERTIDIIQSVQH